MLTSTLRIWGGSVALPIPKKILAIAKLAVGREVAITVEGEKIVISPMARKSFSELLAEHRKLDLPQDDAWLDSAPVAKEML